MPHFHIDYSANIEKMLDMSALCEKIRETAAEIETFPLAGIRVRATCVDHVAMADGDKKHGFIDLSIRLRAGRSSEVKSDALARIFEALQEFAATTVARHSVALSAEIRDIDAVLSAKSGSIRDHMKDIK